MTRYLFPILLCLFMCFLVLMLYPVYWALETGVIPGTDLWFETVDAKQFYFGGKP